MKYWNRLSHSGKVAILSILFSALGLWLLWKLVT